MQLNQDVAYLTGFVIGDGNVSSKSGNYLVRAVEENEIFINSFAELFEKVFNRKPKVYFDRYNNSYVAWIHSKQIWEHFVNDLEVPSGDKSTTVKVPNWIKICDESIKAAFLRGLFDAEGSVIPIKNKSKNNVQISFKVNNQVLGSEVFEILKELGIDARLYLYEYPREKFSMIHINGRERCKQFLEKVGFNHQIKKQKLIQLL